MVDKEKKKQYNKKYYDKKKQEIQEPKQELVSDSETTETKKSSENSVDIQPKSRLFFLKGMIKSAVKSTTLSILQMTAMAGVPILIKVGVKLLRNTLTSSKPQQSQQPSQPSQDLRELEQMALQNTQNAFQLPCFL